jgi:hypothetical protein
MLLQHSSHEERGIYGHTASQEARWSFSRRVNLYSTNSVSQDKVYVLMPATRLFGFLTGSVVAGAVVYYYILGEYRISNNMLTEDIDVRPYLFNLSLFRSLRTIYGRTRLIVIGFTNRNPEAPDLHL